MYKTASRNLIRRAFRSALNAKARRFSLRESRKMLAAKREREFRKAMRTERKLIPMLGAGPEFVTRVYRKFYRDFELQNFDPKRCSAYLNTVAKIQTLNGTLWTDEAIESMFRRTRRKGQHK